MKKLLTVLIFVAGWGGLFASGASSEGSRPAVPFNERGLPITNEVVTVTVAAVKSPNSRTLFSEMVPVMETEKKTNVHIEWMEIPNTGWVEKVNLLIASNDLPDAFAGGNISLTKNLDSFAPLDDSINKYGPAILNLFKERPDIRALITAPDGKIYSLPTGGETYNNQCGDQLWINKAWLDTLGLGIPKTIREFEDTLIAFKEKDPNKNGKADEIPFSACQSGEGAIRISSIFGSFDALYTNTALIVRNGNIVFSPGERGFYDGLLWFHSIYTRGLMDQETFIQNQQQYNAKYKSGETLGSFMAFSPDFTIAPEIADHYIALPPLTGPNGKQPVWKKGGNINNQGFAISRNSRYRDVLVRLYDHLNSSLEIMLEWGWGPKDYAWRMRPDGKWEIASENQPKDMAYGVWRHSTAMASSAPLLMKSAWVGPDAQFFTTERDRIKIEAVTSYLPFLEKEYVTANLLTLEDETTRNLLWVELDNYLKRFVAQAVMNGIDEAAWNTHLTTLRTLKADEYTAITQKYYIPVQ